MTYSLQLPEKISLNKIYGGINWRDRADVVDNFHSSLYDMKGRTVKIKNYPVTISYEFHFKSKPLDSSNCAFMAKMIEDAFIVHGILKGDSIEYVSETRLKSRKSLEKSTDDMVYITVTDS